MPETEHLGLFKLKNLFLLFFIFNCSIAAQVYPDAAVDKLLQKGIGYILNQEYSSAKSVFTSLNDKYPLIPLGKIYLSAVYIAEAYDLAEPFNDEVISRNINAAISQSEGLLTKNKSNTWNIYFLALAEGYKAYYEALKGNWLTGLSEGLSSVSGFEDCLKQDTSFYEAYTAIGAYKYWKSAKTEFINWLPFVDDEKEIGIDYLEAAIKKSKYNYYIGIYSLQWIYIDKDEPHKAIRVSEKALKEFPRSRFFKYGYARALQDTDLKKAIRVYSDILDSYSLPGNYYNEIFLKHLIAQCHQKLGENKKALELCNEILAIKPLSDYVIDKLGDRLERVKALKRELLSKE